MRGFAYIVALVFVMATPAVANEHEEHSGIKISDVWARPTAAANGAVYLRIENDGASDSLIAASSPRAEKTELHTTIRMGEVVRMQPLKAVALPHKKSVTFLPGANHIMLLGLTEPLKGGDRFPVTLEFTKGAPMTIEVVVGDGPVTIERYGHDHK